MKIQIFKLVDHRVVGENIIDLSVHTYEFARLACLRGVLDVGCHPRGPHTRHDLLRLQRPEEACQTNISTMQSIKYYSPHFSSTSRSSTGGGRENVDMAHQINDPTMIV